MATPSAPALPRPLHRRAGQVRDHDRTGCRRRPPSPSRSSRRSRTGRLGYFSREGWRRHQWWHCRGPLALDRLFHGADRGLWRHPVHRHCRGPCTDGPAKSETMTDWPSSTTTPSPSRRQGENWPSSTNTIKPAGRWPVRLVHCMHSPRSAISWSRSRAMATPSAPALPRTPAPTGRPSPRP